MDQETHIADREPRDAADFLVTEAILELQANNLLLIGRQPVDQAQDDRQCFSGLEFRPGPRLGGQHTLGSTFSKPLHPSFLAIDIEHPVAAHGEEPFRQMPVDRRLGLGQETHKRVLNRVAGPVGITQQTRGVTQELRLELLDGRAHESGIFMGAIGRWWVRIHVLVIPVMTCARRSS